MHHPIALFSGLSMFFSETLRDHPDKTAEFIKQMEMITAKSGFLDFAAISGRASYIDFFLMVRLIGENPF